MSKTSRTKGQAGEREAAALLAKLYPDAKRTLSQARGGCEACDVDGTPWFVEVKRDRCVNPAAALRKATAEAVEAADERPALVMYRRDREPWTVTMAWADFERLAREGVTSRELAKRVAKAFGRGEPAPIAGGYTGVLRIETTKESA